jgi:hypothetical protein
MHNEDTTTVKQASLLGIPTELRIQIFSPFLPDLDMIPPRLEYLHKASNATWELNSKDMPSLQDRGVVQPHQTVLGQEKVLSKDNPYRRRLRKDDAACWPPLLRVSRQIHDECYDIIYQRRTFQLVVGYEGVEFLHMNVWASPAAEPDEEKVLDAMMAQVNSLEIQFRGTSRSKPEPLFASKRFENLLRLEKSAEENLMWRIRLLVACIRRVGTIRKIVFRDWQESNKANSGEYDRMYQPKLALSRPFESLRNLEVVDFFQGDHWFNDECEHPSSVRITEAKSVGSLCPNDSRHVR